MKSQTQYAAKPWVGINARLGLIVCFNTHTGRQHDAHRKFHAVDLPVNQIALSSCAYSRMRIISIVKHADDEDSFASSPKSPPVPFPGPLGCG